MWRARSTAGPYRRDPDKPIYVFYLSAITLAGLGLNALLGWWWAAPVAALIMVPIIAHARESLEGRGCECGHE